MFISLNLILKELFYKVTRLWVIWGTNIFIHSVKKISFIFKSQEERVNVLISVPVFFLIKTKFIWLGIQCHLKDMISNFIFFDLEPFCVTVTCACYYLRSLTPRSTPLPLPVIVKPKITLLNGIHNWKLKL